MSPRVREARDDRDWRVVDSERPAFAATSVMLYGNMEIWKYGIGLTSISHIISGNDIMFDSLLVCTYH